MVVVSGELDLASGPVLEQELDGVHEAGSQLVILDLRELAFMDSTGLGVVIKAHAKAQESGRRLCLVKGPEQVQRLLSLTGVADRFDLVDAPEDALRGA